MPQSPVAGVPQAPAPGGLGTTAQTLGDEGFRRAYGLSYAYGGGAPCRGIRTAEWVIGLAQGGCLAFLDPWQDSGAAPGVAGTPAAGALRAAIETVRRALGPQASFGVSLYPPPVGPGFEDPNGEEQAVAAALELGVDCAEAVGYHRITPALVRFRYQGAHRDADGRPVARRRLLALVQRPGTAHLFLRPAPDKVLSQLVHQGQLTAAEAEIARHLPLASDLCAVTGSGDGPDLANLLPSLRRLRDGAMAEHGYLERIRVGAGGALGTPEAVACAFFLGADFVHPGSIHLCCRQGGLPEKVRRHLASLEPGDTVSVPAAAGFSLGARVQVVKKGSFFAPRAQKLYELFRFYDSLEAIDPLNREKLEQTYFKRSFADIWNSLAAETPRETAQADAKTRMALVFSWYLHQSLRWALEGHDAEKVNFQIPCDEAVAAFNLTTANTDLAAPQNRTAPAIAHRLLEDAAAFLRQRVEASG
jgi:trans-AT polyketide synthase/acyltransferase/oxidoreductase domain-containing protein